MPQRGDWEGLRGAAGEEQDQPVNSAWDLGIRPFQDEQLHPSLPGIQRCKDETDLDWQQEG